MAENSIFVKLMKFLCFLSIIAVVYCFDQLKDEANDYSCTLERSLFGNGFHRQLNSKIVIIWNNESELRSLIGCEAFLLQEIPSGLYIDPFEIETLHGFGGPEVLSVGNVELEMPSFRASPSLVYIFSPLVIHKNSLLANFTLPVHIRYHQSGQDSTTHVPLSFMNSPIFVACHPDVHWPLSFERSFAPCSADMHKVNCSWTEIPCSVSIGDDQIKVPVGNINDLTLVVSVTVLVVSVTTVCLVVAMIIYRDDNISG